MKINRLETHDRLQYFAKQKDEISECCQSLINQRPFGDRPFYIFAHKREIGLDEKYSLFLTGVYKDMAEIPSARIIWQPRLTKPKAQTNSMLFKGFPGTDSVQVIWIIPERELWDQYRKGKMTQSQAVIESINRFENDRASLEAPDPDDPSEEQCDGIYRELSINARNKRNTEALNKEFKKI